MVELPTLANVSELALLAPPVVFKSGSDLVTTGSCAVGLAGDSGAAEIGPGA